MNVLSIPAMLSRKTIKFCCTLTIGLALLSGMKQLRAQSPTTWIWANSATGTDVASSCSQPALDQDENAYIIGSFRSSDDALTFSNSPISLTNFNPDVFSLFLAKYDKDGDLLWARSFKSGETSGELIAVAASGAIYCTGTYKDSIRIDNTTLEGGSSYYTPFLAKFSTDGDLIWAKNMTSAAAGYYLFYEALAIDADDNLLLTGTFNQGTVLFDNLPVHNSDNAANSYDYFVTRLNPDGNVLWTASGGTPDKDDYGRLLCISSAGAFYVGTSYVDTGVIMNGGQINVFKYDHTDMVAWNEVINGTTGVGLGAITSDAEGSLYLSGSYSGLIELDTISLGTAGRGSFVVKYNTIGDAIWANASTANATDVSVFTSGIAVDYAGKVSVSGAYVYSLLTPVTTLTFDTITLTLQGNRDAFLAQYNSDGSVMKAMSIGGSYSEYSSGLNLLSNGTLYYTGSFYSPTVLLDNLSLTNTPNAEGNHYGKFFIAKYGKQEGTGIPDLADDKWLTLYPNPTDGLFILDAIGPIKALKIIDPLGRQVYNEVMPAGTKQYQLNISSYAKGLYYVYVYAAGGAHAVKTLSLR